MGRLSAVVILSIATACRAVVNTLRGNAWQARDDLKPLLANISDWAMTLGVGRNNITGNPKPNFVPGSIFVNGNLARVLIASWRIFGNQSFLDEALAWCDTVAALQRPITTSTGLEGGWWDTGYNAVYIADTGTAATAMALCWHESAGNSTRRGVYENALRRFTRLVTQGCTEPANATKYGPDCPPSGQGWVHYSGDGFPSDWAGSLGDGWYEDALNIQPYTIATATTGSCFFPHLWMMNLTDNGAPGDSPSAQQASLASMSLAAGAWIIGNRTANGTIPYVITPPDPGAHLYQCISYTAESFIALDLFMQDHARPTLLQLATTVQLLLQLQNADGSWGVLDSGDGERSPRAASLLQWWYSSISPDPSVLSAIDKYTSFVTSHWAAYKVTTDALVTGFVGLAFADMIQPWCTFGPLPT